MNEGAELGTAVERSEARAVLRNDTFRNLLYAAATSSIGDWIGLFALIALAETLAGPTRIGALTVSFVMIARVVPTLFLAPLAGVFVDRWDRKRTMIFTDVVRGVVMLGIAFVGDVFSLVLATFVIEVAAALFIPAKDATVPTIVREDRLVQANQLALFSTYATLPIGALLAAVVIAATKRAAGLGSLVERFPDAMEFLSVRPEAVPIILNALSFFVSIWFIRRMDVPDEHVQAYEQRATQTNALEELRDGLEFIAGMPLIRALVVGITTAFLAAGVVIGVGEFFATILNASDSGFATLGFVVGVGLVLGIVGAGPLSERIPKERLFAPGVGLAGVALVVAALMPTLWLVALPALLMGIGAGVAFILGYTMLQEYSHDEVRGRTFAAFNAAVRMALFTALVVGPLSIVVLGVERTNAQINAGQESIEDIEQFDEEGRYPYQIGGVRLTLIMSGVLALGGAVWTGRSIASVLRRRAEGEDIDGLAAPATVDARAEPPSSGVLVVLEGGEGAGKSTQLQLLREALTTAGVEPVVTREPGGTPMGEAVREVLLDADGDVAPRTEALLYAAARAQHVQDVLRPAVEAGRVVLCDRYIDSSIVYQGEGRELGTGIIADLNRWATDELVPDLTVLLDLAAEEGLRRAREVDEPDRLEAAGLEFHERVNAAFRRWAAREPERYLVLDAREPAEELHAAILHRLRRVLPQDVVAALDEAAEAAEAREAAAAEAAAPVAGPPDPFMTQPMPEDALGGAFEDGAAEGHAGAAAGEPGEDRDVDGGEVEPARSDEDGGASQRTSRARSEPLFAGFAPSSAEDADVAAGPGAARDTPTGQPDEPEPSDRPHEPAATNDADDADTSDADTSDDDGGAVAGSVPAWLTLPIEDPERS